MQMATFKVENSAKFLSCYLKFFPWIVLKFCPTYFKFFKYSILFTLYLASVLVELLTFVSNFD
jgi:hypothetical protein